MYQVLVFAQNGGGQELWLVCKEDDEYAVEIMKRVLDSVELKKAIPNE